MNSRWGRRQVSVRDAGASVSDVPVLIEFAPTPSVVVGHRFAKRKKVGVRLTTIHAPIRHDFRYPHRTR